MKQPTFCGRELLSLSVIEAARAGDPLAVERVLRYYEGYINKPVIELLFQLVAGQNCLVTVDDDYVITAVNVRCECGLVLTTQQVCSLCSDTAQRLAGSVQHIPLAIYFASLRHSCCHSQFLH